ncbi:pilus assembly FimT family protein [Brassicibacter mesophilus]|uniref:pilus assembly FimT family protein n=1 Tax=Brassicibacter mesophilus TaxID=745119 RepID=UPI003D21140E
MRRQKYDRGMTLIELLVVLSLLAIIASMVIPKIDRRDYFLMASSRMLRDDIRSIRYMKMTEGKNYKISLEYNRYVISRNSIQVKDVKLEKNFKIVHNISGGNVWFSYIGAPLQSGTIRVLDDETNRYCEITIVPATGRILLKNQIFEGYIKNKSN